MICPHCNAETSDMMNVCELCGEPLNNGVSQPYVEAAPGDATAQVHGLPDGAAPSEWPPSDAGLPPAGTVRPSGKTRRVSGAGRPWYLSPWPYLVGIAIVAAVAASLLLLRPKAKAYPELLVNNQPTLLNFYTDT